MSQSDAPPGSGDNAHIWTGIRDIQIWVGETSQGNKLMGGPYRWPELAAILFIMGPVLIWIRHHPQSPDLLKVFGLGVASTLILVVALRFLLPKARPDFFTRAQFFATAVAGRRAATSVRPNPLGPSTPAVRPAPSAPVTVRSRRGSH